jgi:inner membrane protein involved in colicin E2 resistance
MRNTRGRLLHYGSILLAAIASLLTSLIGGIYLSILVAGKSQAIWLIHIVSALGIAGALWLVFKKTPPLHRTLIAGALLILTVFAMPRHNCGPEC